MDHCLSLLAVCVLATTAIVSYTQGLNESTDKVRETRRDIDRAITKCMQFSNDLTKEKLRAYDLERKLITLGGQP